jgi:hypothetical protein
MKHIKSHAGHKGASQNLDPNLPTKAEIKPPGKAALARERILLEARQAASSLHKQGNECHAQGNYTAASKAYKEVSHRTKSLIMWVVLPLLIPADILAINI